jgi:hypothetical protein
VDEGNEDLRAGLIGELAGPVQRAEDLAVIRSYGSQRSSADQLRVALERASATPARHVDRPIRGLASGVSVPALELGLGEVGEQPSLHLGSGVPFAGDLERLPDQSRRLVRRVVQQ